MKFIKIQCLDLSALVNSLKCPFPFEKKTFIMFGALVNAHIHNDVIINVN